MATQASTTNDLPADRTEGTGGTQALPHPVVLGGLSGFLLWLAFPPAEWTWSAWLALIPLFLLVGSRRKTWTLYLGAEIGGFVFWMLALHWIMAADPTAWLGWLAMASFLSLSWPIFLFLTRFARKRLNLPLMVSAPLFWVALEYGRAHILTGFPWFYLAHTQYQFSYLTQIADVTGALGLSVLIVLVNAYAVDLLTLPLFRRQGLGSSWSRLVLPQKARLVVVILAIAGTLGYGGFRVSTARFRPGLRVALLQTSDITEQNPSQRRRSADVQAGIEALIRTAHKSDPRPDLIVWPETANPWGFVTIDPTLSPQALETLVKTIDPGDIAADWTLRRDRVDAYFASLMDWVRIPMMVGSSLEELRPSGYFRFNAAILFRPNLATQVYHKLHLVPFGEYVPLLKPFPWLIKLTPFQGARFLDHGAHPRWFDLGSQRLAVAICFEDTVPQVVRRFFREAPGDKQPDLLVNLSNDGWFRSTVEHETHLAVSTFRCIENRVPMVRAVNTGVSALIDGNGQIVKSLGKLKTGVLIETTPLDDRESLYSQWGDWLGQFCLASTIGLLVLGTFSPRRPKGVLNP